MFASNWHFYLGIIILNSGNIGRVGAFSYTKGTFLLKNEVTGGVGCGEAPRESIMQEGRKSRRIGETIPVLDIMYRDRRQDVALEMERN